MLAVEGCGKLGKPKTNTTHGAPAQSFQLISDSFLWSLHKAYSTVPQHPLLIIKAQPKSGVCQNPLRNLPPERRAARELGFVGWVFRTLQTVG